MLMVKFRSIKAISEEFSVREKSALNHFLMRSPWDEREILAQMQREIKGKMKTDRIYLIIDDTAMKREGPNIEGTGVHFGSDGLVKGHSCVFSAVIAGVEKYVWDFRAYVSKSVCSSEKFRSKVEIAQELIRDVCFDDREVVVMFDSWYTNAKVMRTVNEKGFAYIGGLKKNRRIWLNGKKSRVSHLAKGPRGLVKVKCGDRTFFAARVLAEMPRVGEVAIFVVRNAKFGIRYIVSNDLKMTCRDAVKSYALRFWIETQFREMKQQLGLGELHMRKMRGIQKHWVLVVLAYDMIQLARKSRSTGATLKSLRREFVGRDSKKWIERFIRKAS
jgi:SRSO17 transposase